LLLVAKLGRSCANLDSTRPTATDQRKAVMSALVSSGCPSVNSATCRSHVIGVEGSDTMLRWLLAGGLAGFQNETAQQQHE